MHPKPKYGPSWWAEAAKHNVLPLDWRGVERFNAEAMGRPSLGGADRKSYTYYPGQIGLPSEGSPRVLNKSWTLTADIQVPETGVDGVIVTQGGLEGGYGLYIRDGKPTFVYNDLAMERYTVAAATPLPKGQVQLKVDFAYSGGADEVGKGATELFD